MAEGGMTQDKESLLYLRMKQLTVTKTQLNHHGYPRPGADGTTAQFLSSKNTPCKTFNDSKCKVCRRCEEDFIIDGPDRITGGMCEYHYGRCWNNVWKCCGKRRGSRGCTTSETHVHDDNLRDPSGYVTTSSKTIPENGNPGMYAIDCEMSYTVGGLELTNVSILDHNLETVFNSYVKPYGRMLCYNTIHSGVTERDLRDVTTTLKDVQDFMLEKFSKDTVLIGHSLESDFVALRLIHETVVDTSLIYPHPKGLPYKSALRTLAQKHLGMLIQHGRHDSKEDATVCMKLAIAKAENQISWSSRGRRGFDFDDFLFNLF